MPDPDLPTPHDPSDAIGGPAFAAPAILAGLAMTMMAVHWIYPRAAIQRAAPAPPPTLHQQPDHDIPRTPPPPVLSAARLSAARYERSDVSMRSALIAFPAILVGLFLTIMLVRWIYPTTAIDQRLPAPPPVFPSPRLQADPQADMTVFLQQELARLNSGGWDDEARGLGHIPIDDAMRRVAASGIPDWPK